MSVPDDSATSDALADVRFDERGLVVAVVQHAEDDRLLMVGYMNREALELSIGSGHVTFWSRSRQALWRKGETSGNTLTLVELRLDCDGDAILVRALPAGPTCHTGESSCFYRRHTHTTWTDDHGPTGSIERTFTRVYQVILERQAGRGATSPTGRSYVRTLLDAGLAKIGAKIREEADELAVALEAETPERVASEAADLLFHALVGFAARSVPLRALSDVLASRFGTSGIDEKAAR